MFNEVIDKLKEWFGPPPKPDIEKYLRELTTGDLPREMLPSSRTPEAVAKRNQSVAGMVIRESMVAIERIKPNDGDVLFLTIKESVGPQAYQNIAESVSEWAKEKGYKDRNVNILFLAEGAKVNALSEADMKKHGWVRR